MVALTFDLDPDQFDSSIGDDRDDGVLAWRGVDEGVPRLADLLGGIQDTGGGSPRSTWFVRVDDEIKALYGEVGYMLDRHDDQLRRLAADGSEIAWHPHLCRRVDGRWQQETDEARLAAILRRGYAAMFDRGWIPRVTRMGGNVGSNGIMETLDSLGVAFDSTAMPGRQRNDGERRFDWEPTPSAPYRPACDDYRRPGRPARDLVEVPLTMVPVRAEYDVAPIRRYVDFSFHPHALAPGLAACLADIRLLVTITHPGCILPEVATRPHGLLSFDLSAFRRNLEALVEACQRLGRPFRFVTLSEGARLVGAAEK